MQQLYSLPLAVLLCLLEVKIVSCERHVKALTEKNGIRSLLALLMKGGNCNGYNLICIEFVITLSVDNGKLRVRDQSRTHDHLDTIGLLKPLSLIRTRGKLAYSLGPNKRL